MNSVLMYGGGIDSFLAYQYLRMIGEHPICVYYNLGHLYAKDEMKVVKSFIPDIRISECLKLGDIETESSYIPNRNILAAIQSVGEFSADKVWIGGTLSDRVNDNNPDLFNKLSDIMTSVHGRKIVISSPFWSMHKNQVVSDYYNLWKLELHGVPKSKDQLEFTEKQNLLLQNTYSCYHPTSLQSQDYYLFNRETLVSFTIKEHANIVQHKTTECMSCPACFRKSVALLSANIFRNFRNSSIVREYFLQASMINSDTWKNCGDGYMLERYKATLTYCEKWKQFNPKESK